MTRGMRELLACVLFGVAYARCDHPDHTPPKPEYYRPTMGWNDEGMRVYPAISLHSLIEEGLVRLDPAESRIYPGYHLITSAAPDVWTAYANLNPYLPPED